MITLHPARVGAPLGTLELHDQIVKAHGIIPINGALVSLREDHLQVPVPAGYKCRASLCCRNGKATVELGNVAPRQTGAGERACGPPIGITLKRNGPSLGNFGCLHGTKTKFWIAT
jgi:hypothetical protein